MHVESTVLVTVFSQHLHLPTGDLRAVTYSEVDTSNVVLNVLRNKRQANDFSPTTSPVSLTATEVSFQPHSIGYYVKFQCVRFDVFRAKVLASIRLHIRNTEVYTCNVITVLLSSDQSRNVNSGHFPGLSFLLLGEVHRFQQWRSGILARAFFVGSRC